MVFYGIVFDICEWFGIVDYDCVELVIIVCSGILFVEIEVVLVEYW